MDPLDAADIALVRADNPGPFTLEGTNTWLDRARPLLGRRSRAAGARAARRARRRARPRRAAGSAGSRSRTATPTTPAPSRALLARCGDAPVAARGLGARDGATSRDGDALRSADGDRDARATRPITSRSSPAARCSAATPCSGAAASSCFPDPGALSGYLAALERAAGAADSTLICPGHGPLVDDPQAVIRAIPRASPGPRAAPGRGARRRACAAPTSCSTASGPTRRPRCAAPPPSRSPRTSTSCAEEGAAAGRGGTPGSWTCTVREAAIPDALSQPAAVTPRRRCRAPARKSRRWQSSSASPCAGSARRTAGWSRRSRTASSPSCGPTRTIRCRPARRARRASR